MICIPRTFLFPVCGEDCDPDSQSYIAMAVTPVSLPAPAQAAPAAWPTLNTPSLSPTLAQSHWEMLEKYFYRSKKIFVSHKTRYAVFEPCFWEDFIPRTFFMDRLHSFACHHKLRSIFIHFQNKSCIRHDITLSQVSNLPAIRALSSVRREGACVDVAKLN